VDSVNLANKVGLVLSFLENKAKFEELLYLEISF